MAAAAAAASSASSSALLSASLLAATAATAASLSDDEDDELSPEERIVMGKVLVGVFLTVFWLLCLMSPPLISWGVRWVWFRGRRRPETVLDWTIPVWNFGLGGIIYTAISVTILAYTISKGYEYEKVAKILTMIASGYLGGNLILIPIWAKISMWKAKRRETRLNQRAADVERGVTTQAVGGSEAPPRYEEVDLRDLTKA